jgi:hypothetical protein
VPQGGRTYEDPRRFEPKEGYCYDMIFDLRTIVAILLCASRISAWIPNLVSYEHALCQVATSLSNHVQLARATSPGKGRN